MNFLIARLAIKCFFFSENLAKESLLWSSTLVGALIVILLGLAVTKYKYQKKKKSLQEQAEKEMTTTYKMEEAILTEVEVESHFTGPPCKGTMEIMTMVIITHTIIRVIIIIQHDRHHCHRNNNNK